MRWKSCLASFGVRIMFRALDKWLVGYLRSIVARPRAVPGPKHIMFCIADHFEPFRKTIAPDGSISGGLSDKEGAEIVEDWCRRYRESVVGLTDSDGRPPRHTFFYPADEYNPDCLDILAGICGEGYGDVEVHIHHRNDTAERLTRKLVDYRDILRNRHGLLGSDRDGNIRYGFVHGNWALCNSRPDGDWCGVDQEIGVLMDTGCYADFTFPSAPSPTQPRMVNVLYRAMDREERSRGHDEGKVVVVGDGEKGEGLVMMQGPLCLNWGNRKYGLLPRLENGSLAGWNPPDSDRCDLWVKQHICVQGRPEWVFVKVYTHGCTEGNMAALFGESMKSLHGHLCDKYDDGAEWRNHYVTAREMYNIVRAAEDGCTGNPGDFRDYEVSGVK
ncbi:MAG: hypothetical protein KAH23_04260, partial [Kiritimatiellae bacterium]|nr:hypothetical protein [Kiritimatiellia bacterium]